MEDTESFTQHLNSLDQDMKFTSEREKNDALMFLDTLTCKQADESVKVKSVSQGDTRRSIPKFSILSACPLQTGSCTNTFSLS